MTDRQHRHYLYTRVILARRQLECAEDPREKQYWALELKEREHEANRTTPAPVSELGPWLRPGESRN